MFSKHIYIYIYVLSSFTAEPSRARRCRQASFYG